METKQPEWKEVAQLGDVNWIEEGGLFVYEDTTGVYPPEMCKVFFMRSSTPTWDIRRVILEPCTFQNGVLSDNKFHPDKPAWFAEGLEGVASYIGQPLDELVLWFLSSDLMLRARAWEAVGNYHGWDNLDAYPLLEHDREKVLARFTPK